MYRINIDKKLSAAKYDNCRGSNWKGWHVSLQKSKINRFLQYFFSIAKSNFQYILDIIYTEYILVYKINVFEL